MLSIIHLLAATHILSLRIFMLLLVAAFCSENILFLEAIHPLLGSHKRFISMKEVTAIPHQVESEAADEGDFSVALHLTGGESLACVNAKWMKVSLTVDTDQVKCCIDHWYA